MNDSNDKSGSSFWSTISAFFVLYFLFGWIRFLWKESGAAADPNPLNVIGKIVLKLLLICVAAGFIAAAFKQFVGLLLIASIAYYLFKKYRGEKTAEDTLNEYGERPGEEAEEMSEEQFHQFMRDYFPHSSDDAKKFIYSYETDWVKREYVMKALADQQYGFERFDEWNDAYKARYIDIVLGQEKICYFDDLTRRQASARKWCAENKGKPFPQHPKDVRNNKILYGN